jgi:hypothetical protein
MDRAHPNCRAVAAGKQLLLDIHQKLIVDLFAGGGGMSTAFEMAFGRSPDIAINHDDDALSLHRANHPLTRHFIADVFEVEPQAATQGRPVGWLHLSPTIQWGPSWREVAARRPWCPRSCPATTRTKATGVVTCANRRRPLPPRTASAWWSAS